MPDKIEPPFFSVVIPTFNRAVVLKNAIQSVLVQSFPDWELLVIDDGSTDNTKEIVESFQDTRINYFYKANEERSAARNFGIKRVTGDYICFLDSDDIYFSNHLNCLYAEIEQKKFPKALLHTQLYKYENEKRQLLNWFYGLERDDVLNGILLGKALYINAVCVSRRILEEKKFPVAFSYWEDQHLWIRILADYPFYSIADVTTQWNIGDSNSVNENFKIEPAKKLNAYLSCITDVEKSKEITKLQLKPDLFRELKLKKTSLFLTTNSRKRRTAFWIRAYIITLRYVNFYETNSFFFSRIIKLNL